METIFLSAGRMRQAIDRLMGPYDERAVCTEAEWEQARLDIKDGKAAKVLARVPAINPTTSVGIELPSGSANAFRAAWWLVGK